MWKETELQCGSFLTCPTHRVAGGGGENLRGKVFKGHDLSVVLNNGLQVERPLLVAGQVSLRETSGAGNEAAVKRSRETDGHQYQFICCRVQQLQKIKRNNSYIFVDVLHP